MNILGRIYIGVTVLLVLLSVYVLYFRAETKSTQHQNPKREAPIRRQSAPDVNDRKELSQTPAGVAEPVEPSTLPPETPTDLTIDHLESDGILLQWYCASGNVDEFVILSAPYDNAPPIEFASVPGYRTFYEIEPVDLYDTRYFSVYASNAYGTSVESETVKHHGYYERNRRRDQWRHLDYRVGRAVIGILIWSFLGFPIVGRATRGPNTLGRGFWFWR